MHHGVEGLNGGIPAQGFQEAQLCLFPAPWGRAYSGPYRGCFSLAVTPLPVSCYAAHAMLLWLCSEPCHAPLLPWGPSAVGLGLHVQCPPVSLAITSLPFQLSHPSSGPCSAFPGVSCHFLNLLFSCFSPSVLRFPWQRTWPWLVCRAPAFVPLCHPGTFLLCPFVVRCSTLAGVSD